MWWWLLGGILAAVAVSVVINAIITRDRIKKAAKEKLKKDVGRLIIDSVNRTTNVVKMHSLDNKEKLEMTGTGIADDIKKGSVIYV